MIKRGHHPLKRAQTVCAQNDQPGDERCSKMSSSPLQLSSPGGDSLCGCQKCPDQQTYDNSVQDYCKAQPSTLCPSKQRVQCRLVCASDPRCKTMQFDHSEVGCACACQVCPDKQYYQATANYTSPDAVALTSAQQSQCPDVLHPVKQARDLCK